MTSTVLLDTLAVGCLLNLVLLLGIVRRLNQLTGWLAGGAGGPTAGATALSRSTPAAGSDTGLPAPGSQIRDFAVPGTDGRPLTQADLVGATLVGFFSIGCKLCKDFAPRFAALAREFPGGRDRVLSVVVGLPGQPTDLVELLSPVSRVSMEKFGGPAATAFRVEAFPSFCLLDGRLVTASGTKPESLRLPTPGAARSDELQTAH